MPAYLKRVREVEEKIEAMGTVPQPPPQKPRQLTWICDHCGASNPDTEFKCHNCGGAR